MARWMRALRMLRTPHLRLLLRGKDMCLAVFGAVQQLWQVLLLAGLVPFHTGLLLGSCAGQRVPLRGD